ncbi:MAG TPA: hypothetical protein VJ946_01760, partial [Bacteroidales bacterium]|nr:hypothetical protein [Bacteroidales bacterium]
YIFRMFLAFFTGSIHRLRHIRIISCSYAKITFTPPQDLQIDGEPSGEVGNLEIENIPSAVDAIYNDRQEHLLFKPSRILK